MAALVLEHHLLERIQRPHHTEDKGPMAKSEAKHVTNISRVRRRVERSWQSRDLAQQLQKLIRLWSCCSREGSQQEMVGNGQRTQVC